VLSLSCAKARITILSWEGGGGNKDLKPNDMIASTNGHYVFLGMFHKASIFTLVSWGQWHYLSRKKKAQLEHVVCMRVHTQTIVHYNAK